MHQSLRSRPSLSLVKLPGCGSQPRRHRRSPRTGRATPAPRRGSLAGSRPRRGRRLHALPSRQTGPAAASASPSRRNRRWTCWRSRGGPRPPVSDSGRRPKARPRHRDRCGSGPCRASRETAPEGGPGIDPDDETGEEHRRWQRARRPARDRGSECGPVAPHVELASQSLDLVERRVAPFRLVVIRRW